MDDELSEDSEEKPVEIDEEGLGDPALIDPTLDIAEPDDLEAKDKDDDEDEDEEDGD